MSLLAKITNNRSPAATSVTAIPAASVATTLADQPQPAVIPRSNLPLPIPKSPPIPCLICSCPIAWMTIYDVESDIPPREWQLRCGECDPPPGRSFVGGKWIVKVGPGGDLIWRMFERGSLDFEDVSFDADHNPLADHFPGSQDWSRWVELAYPDGHTAMAHPGWRRVNLVRLEQQFGIDDAWSILQRRTDRFFERMANG